MNGIKKHTQKLKISVFIDFLVIFGPNETRNI